VPNLLELAVKGCNINDGHNPEMLRRSRSMGDYAKFIALIRKNQEAGMPLGEAIATAMRRCIDEGVMADYLKTRGSEVENMIFTEFNIDVAKEVWMEEARQDGREAGLEAGMEAGLEKAAKAALAKGFSISDVAGITGLDEGTLTKLKSGIAV
jgi:hypothetical protein